MPRRKRKRQQIFEYERSVPAVSTQDLYPTTQIGADNLELRQARFEWCNEQDKFKDKTNHERRMDVESQAKAEPVTVVAIDKPAAGHTSGNVLQDSAKMVCNSKRPHNNMDNPASTGEQVSKKRKALSSINDSSSRLNVLANNSVDIKSKSQIGDHTDAAQMSNPIQDNRHIARSEPENSHSCGAKHRMDWPRMSNPLTFQNTTISEQRMELTMYMADLKEYTDMIQAGAIPTSFIETFFQNLNSHFLKSDAILDTVETHHKREALRKVQLAALLQQGDDDHREVQSLLNELELPNSRKAEARLTIQEDYDDDDNDEEGSEDEDEIEVDRAGQILF